MIVDQPRIGVVGAGWWATEHHLPSIAAFDGARLVAVVDTSIDRARAAAVEFGAELVFSDADELFASGAVDAVIVATTHATHHGLARSALDHGLHVLVEKPLALTGSDAWDLVERADDQGLVLMVGYTYQFTSSAQQLRSAVADGLLGDLYTVAAIFTSSVERFYRGEWEPESAWASGPQRETYSDPDGGGGQGHTQVTHALGMALTVTDSEPAEAQAYMTRAGLEVDLADAISFRLIGGAVGSVASCGSIRGDQPNVHMIHYLGSEGVAVQDLLTATVTLAPNDGPAEILVLSAGEPSYPADAPARRFAEAICGRPGNPAPGVPAARTAALLEAAYRSAEEGRPVGVWSPEVEKQPPS